MSDRGSLSLCPLNRVLSPPLNLIPPNTPPRLFSAAVEHFTSIPWCADLLLAESPTAAISFIPQCFNPASDRHDQFVGATLATPRALRHMLCFFRPDDARHLRDPARPVTRVSALFALGEGLCGYEALLHGGMTTTMVDETLGVINELNTALGKTGSLYAASSVTASLNIKFLRPIPAEGEVCVTAWVEGVEGRKTLMKAEVTGPEGEKMAVAESVWVAVKPKI
ncbi:Uncharacterized protein TPAR_03965 [Tolypocladium paradoxum]|uniref:Thioesterase domain-containing protein n=1 Tax=Tolypocladium paradoxum TaxID=94208 RepID=A0A2S4L072_9HYPO|nr:Uncharacterized protein TPAR_03965 [Tolypocladium paradoxum]